MDPNLFHLDYDRLLEVLVALIVVSLFVERTLSVFYETEFFNKLIERRIPGRSNRLMDVIGLKSWIAFGLSVAICAHWHLDALTIILASHAKTTHVGEIFTGGIVAGGSKVSRALFQDVLGIMSTSEKIRRRK